MVTLIIALTLFAEEPGGTLPENYSYPVTNPTEIQEGNLLSFSTDEFRRLTQLKQPEEKIVKEPFAPFCSAKWFGQVLGVLSREQCRISIGTTEPFDITADDGTLWLSGRVASIEQKVLVLEMARRINGVKQVVNDFTITQRGGSP